ncbi:hypothetical protein [Pseudomonas rustica]|uniref:Uncharacterized protein n=1 Tax=Pseudomonas rustica TaxID=2827099 RepID=A0ABS5MZ97_9PSED|nr:hypothetical protein [Pseudomonas rustica]MBS4079627.1 hypothetical protein [Pseudomonas rustica]
MTNNKNGNDDDKIPRDHFVIGHTTEKVEHFTISYDPVTGVPSIQELDPESLRSQISYEKQNGKDKVIYSTPVEDFKALNRTHLDQLKGQFDYLIAVDTNTIKEPERTQGCRVSVCASSAIAEPLASVSSQVALQPVAAYLILDPGPTVNPEPLGWHLVISQLSRVPALSSKRIGVVVDSELGQHIDINARKKPYHGEHMLPANMTLVYASSDKPEIFVNQMLKHCDAMGKLGIEEFKKSDPSLMSRVRGEKHGTAICVPIVQKQTKPPAA